jgi:hypothetical protein
MAVLAGYDEVLQFIENDAYNVTTQESEVRSQNPE